jgi:hypothetical protein
VKRIGPLAPLAILLLASPAIRFLKGCSGYAVSIVGPVGQGPPFDTATLQADEKALALDAVQNL